MAGEDEEVEAPALSRRDPLPAEPLPEEPSPEEPEPEEPWPDAPALDELVPEVPESDDPVPDDAVAVVLDVGSEELDDEAFLGEPSLSGERESVR